MTPSPWAMVGDRAWANSPSGAGRVQVSFEFGLDLCFHFFPALSSAPLPWPLRPLMALPGPLLNSLFCEVHSRCLCPKGARNPPTRHQRMAPAMPAAPCARGRWALYRNPGAASALFWEHSSGKQHAQCWRTWDLTPKCSYLLGDSEQVPRVSVTWFPQ